MRIRTAALVLAATGLAFGSLAAPATRPVATLPSATLPNGTVVDLNTGIATAPDGHRYLVSAHELATLRQQSLGESGAVTTGPARVTVTAPAPATRRPPR